MKGRSTVLVASFDKDTGPNAPIGCWDVPLTLRVQNDHLPTAAGGNLHIGALCVSHTLACRIGRLLLARKPSTRTSSEFCSAVSLTAVRERVFPGKFPMRPECQHRSGYSVSAFWLCGARHSRRAHPETLRAGYVIATRFLISQSELDRPGRSESSVLPDCPTAI